MHTFFLKVRGVCSRIGSYVWGWLGAPAAAALMLGVAAMGLHDMYGGAAGPHRLQCYAGVRNGAGAEPPQGITPLGRGAVAELPLPHVRVEYDEGGRVRRVLHCDAQGRMSRFPGSRVAQQQVRYDAGGRVAEKCNYDEANRLTADASGVAVRRFFYDGAGRLVRTCFLNAAGVGVVPRMPGFAQQLISYDAQGRPLVVRHCDASGRPIVNADGEETIEYVYDEVHGVSERCNRVAGELADNVAGFATERTETSENGRAVRRVWLNAAGEPVYNPAVGAVAVLEEQTPSPGVVRRRLCGHDGQVAAAARPASECLQRCDASGHTEWECFNSADGLPIEHPHLGYAERVCEYAPSGRLTREFFWDSTGHPSSCYRKDYTLTDEGEYVLSLFTDGSSELLPL